MKILARLAYWGGVLNRLTGWRLSRLNRLIYRLTGGILGNTTPGAQVILLTTTGRKTGRSHTVPVAAWTDGTDLVVGSFAGGSDSDPQWLHNLRADANARVQLKRTTFSVKAEVVSGDQWEPQLRRIAQTSPFIEFYARRSRRQAPMVRLVRSNHGSA